MNRNDINKIWIEDNAIWIELHDGRIAGEKFSDYPGFAASTPEQCNNYQISYYGLHWPELDEDLSFEGFFTH